MSIIDKAREMVTAERAGLLDQKRIVEEGIALQQARLADIEAKLAVVEVDLTDVEKLEIK